MKNLTAIFTLAFFTLLAFSSCERETWNSGKVTEEVDNRAEGQISLSALQVSVDESTSTVTRAVSTNDFIIRIYDKDKEGKWCKNGSIAKCPKYSLSK